jgi:hypothetical protein
VSLPRGIFGTDQVDVGYDPWQAVRATPLRVGPSGGAPPVLDDADEPVALAVGRHLGRQTTRNPECLDNPPLRASVNGFVWGYCMPPAVRKSGWMQLADLEADLTFAGLACGPADADFDRRRPQACGGHCDGRALRDVRDASGQAVVAAREVYLRYAPGSTAFRYLVRGDAVRQLLRSDNRQWTAVEIRTARWTGRGTRGWVFSNAVRPGDN